MGAVAPAGRSPLRVIYLAGPQPGPRIPAASQGPGMEILDVLFQPDQLVVKV